MYTTTIEENITRETYTGTLHAQDVSLIGNLQFSENIISSEVSREGMLYLEDHDTDHDILFSGESLEHLIGKNVTVTQESAHFEGKTYISTKLTNEDFSYGTLEIIQGNNHQILTFSHVLLIGMLQNIENMCKSLRLGL